MSNKLKKQELSTLVSTEQFNDTLNKLSREANNSVEVYITNAPRLQTITDMMLTMLNEEDTLASLEHKDLIKLLELSTKLQMQPLEQFTKLFMQMSQLHDKMQGNKEIEALRELTEQLTKAKAEAEIIDVEFENRDEATELNSETIIDPLADLLKK